MKPLVALDSHKQISSNGNSYLSYSRLNRYLLCPEQYRLYYIERLRPKSPAASLVFGQFIHLALAQLLANQADPLTVFEELWKQIKDADLRYAGRESWQILSERGMKLLELFIADELPKIENVKGVEKPFKLSVSNLELPLIGFIDLVAMIDGKHTVVDFKTSSSSPDQSQAALSDQLSAYQLVEPFAEQLALCVLIKTKDPRIEWHWTKRAGAELAAFLKKAECIDNDIAAKRFYKRQGQWCSWCDYLPVCMGETEEVKRTLVQID